MSNRLTDLAISVIACVVATLLSWPFWRDFEYWPESHIAWQIYFAVGFVLSIYVFYVFIGSLRLLLTHGADEDDEDGVNTGDAP